MLAPKGPVERNEFGQLLVLGALALSVDGWTSLSPCCIATYTNPSQPFPIRLILASISVWTLARSQTSLLALFKCSPLPIWPRIRNCKDVCNGLRGL